MIYPLKIVFFGTPDPATEILDMLIESNHEVVAVISQPDRRRGRGRQLTPTPVKARSLEVGIPVYEPTNKVELSEVVLALNADVGVVVAYGRILPSVVLEHFPFGCINVHYSLLPKFRGAAPVERAILAGETYSGVSIMKMDEGCDTGGVFVSKKVDIDNKTTTETLFQSMNSTARELLKVVLDHIDTQIPYDQEGEPTYANKLSAEDFYFDSNASCFDLQRKVQAGALVKGAWTYYGSERLRILEISKTISEPEKQATPGTIDRYGELTLGDGTCHIERIQAPGRAALNFIDWANGVGVENFPIEIDK